MEFINPYILIAIIPTVFALVLFLRWEWVKLKQTESELKTKKRMRFFVFITRTIIFTCLIIALAGPFSEIRTKISGNPTVLMIIDNSTSMDVLSLGFIPELKNTLEDELPVRVRFIAHGQKSDIGDGILSNIDEDISILLISDGQNTQGTALQDVSLFASKLNSTINALNLKGKLDEKSVTIIGPNKVVEDVDNIFKIRIYSVGKGTETLTLTVDGANVPIEDLPKQKKEGYDEYTFRHAFSEGYHKMIAKISFNDHFSQNNEYFKTVNAIAQPSILYIGAKNNPLTQVLEKLYSVTYASSLPLSYEQYYAVIINDMPAFSNVHPLADYLIDGNGLVVVGGQHAFDGGDYKDSVFEALLPVRVGSAERRKGNANIAIAIDISGTVGESYVKGPGGKLVLTQGNESLSVAKALAISIMDELALDNNVGVVAFNSEAYKVADIAPLYQNKADVLDKVSRLKSQGQSFFDIGMAGAFELLKTKGGNKAVILITDGYTFNEGIRQNTKNIAASMAQKGIKTFTVGLGEVVDEKFLSEVAELGEGIYFSADESNRLKILFGEIDEKKKTAGVFALFVLNGHHFITRGIKPDAVIHSVNQVIPKSSSRLLMTTDSGEPVLTVWRYGLGRVSALTGFSGDHLGQILNSKNSAIISRTVNWAIGDPERKNQYQITADDTSIGVPSLVTVRSDKIPSFKDFEFTKTDKLLYRAEFIPQDRGFNNVLGATYAVNYEKEYEGMGMSQELKSMVEATGGKIFSQEESSAIIDHVNAVSQRVKIKKTSLKSFFIWIALCVLLIDIGYRKIKEYWVR